MHAGERGHRQSAAVSGPASDPACRRRAAFIGGRCWRKSASAEPQEFILPCGGAWPPGELLGELVQSCFIFLRGGVGGGEGVLGI